MRLWSSLAAGLAVLLVGCATPIDSAQRAKMRRIGVVSVTGAKLHAYHQGLTVFQNRVWTATAPELNIDSTAERIVISRLRGAGIQAQPADRATFQQPEQKPSLTNLFGEPALWNTEEPSIARKVQAICARANLDALIVAYPFVSEAAPFGPHRGIGFYTAKALMLKSSGVYIVLGTRVYDRDGKVIGKGFNGSTPYLTIVKVPWHEAWTEYTPAEKNDLRAKLEGTLEQSLLKQVENLGFR